MSTRTRESASGTQAARTVAGDGRGAASVLASGNSSGPVSALRSLVEARRLVDRDLSLPAMAARIAQAACTVTDAPYARVLLLGVDGEVIESAEHGLSDRGSRSLSELVGPVSCGRGSTDVRLEQLASAGLRCYPLVVRGERFAELYLPRSTPLLADGGVAADGTPGTDVLAALLCICAGALETAMLHTDAERNRNWLHASGEIARSLLADQGADTLMDVVDRALHVADADYASLCLPRPDGLLEVVVASGIGADDYRGFVLDPALSRLAEAVVLGESLLVYDLTEIMRSGFENVHDFGPLMMAPLADAHGVRGSVTLCRRNGRASFTARDLDLATIFADQVVLALGMDDARAQGVWLSLLEDRHRIAQDLHDNVMQRLFATGVGLQSLAAGALPLDIGRRLGRYIDDIDETIEEIRSRVFGLRDANGKQLQRATTRFPYVAKQDTL